MTGIVTGFATPIDPGDEIAPDPVLCRVWVTKQEVPFLMAHIMPGRRTGYSFAARRGMGHPAYLGPWCCAAAPGGGGEGQAV